jgi:hypothetical protein
MSHSPSQKSPKSPEDHKRRDSLAQKFSNIVKKTSLSVVTGNLLSGSAPNTPVDTPATPFTSTDLNLNMNPADYDLKNVIGTHFDTH